MAKTASSRCASGDRSRVGILSKSRALPAGVSAETVTAAQAGVAAMAQGWAQAEEAFKNGNLADAVATGGRVRSRAAEIMGQLGMQVPPALR